MELIDKNALQIKLIGEKFDAYVKGDLYLSQALSLFHSLIHRAPIVEERKHGHWEDKPFAGYCTFRYSCICSVCKKPHEYETNYCPDCGAKMENNGDDDDK